MAVLIPDRLAVTAAGSAQAEDMEDQVDVMSAHAATMDETT